MGWLFAVALGLHRHSQRIVLLALVPIALGHAAAVAAVLAGVLALGRMLDATTLLRLAAIVLTGCAVAHPASFHQRVKRDDHHDQNADDDRKPSRQQQHPPPHRHRPPPCRINPVAPRHHCFGSPSGCCGPSRRLSCWNKRRQQLGAP